MKDLLLNMSGVTETKIFMLDTLIKFADKHDGIITSDVLRTIKKSLIDMCKEAELDDVFNKLEEPTQPRA